MDVLFVRKIILSIWQTHYKIETVKLELVGRYPNV